VGQHVIVRCKLWGCVTLNENKNKKFGLQGNIADLNILKNKKIFVVTIVQGIAI
jgi:hypothetical protein